MYEKLSIKSIYSIADISVVGILGPDKNFFAKRQIYFISNTLTLVTSVTKPGSAPSRFGRILRSGVCFEAPSHIPYIFVVTVVNKIHILNIESRLKSMCMRVIVSQFTKTV